MTDKEKPRRQPFMVPIDLPVLVTLYVIVGVLVAIAFFTKQPDAGNALSAIIGSVGTLSLVIARGKLGVKDDD